MASKQVSSYVRSFDLRVYLWSLIPAIMNNLKCLSAHVCDNLNKEDAIVSVDLIDAYETLHKELLKFMKIAKKFKEELKLANLEKKWIDCEIGWI